MKKFNIFGVLITIILFSALSSALNYSAIDGQEIPEEVSGFVGNQRANIFLDDIFTFSAQINDGKITSSDTKLEKPTLEIYLKNETVNKIQDSENPQDETLAAYKSGEIVIVKKTFMNKIKFFFAKFFI